MATPLSFRARVEPVPLLEDGRVTARVLRIEFNWRLRAAAGGWAGALPFAVTDERFGRRRTVPVVDPSILAAGGALLFALLAVILRKEASNGRGEDVSAGIPGAE